jgi:hypothetical protein
MPPSGVSIVDGAFVFELQTRRKLIPETTTISRSDQILVSRLTSPTLQLS